MYIKLFEKFSVFILYLLVFILLFIYKLYKFISLLAKYIINIQTSEIHSVICTM